MWGLVQGQPWLPATAALLAAVITLVIGLRANPRSKRRREELKLDLEAIKLIGDLRAAHGESEKLERLRVMVQGRLDSHVPAVPKRAIVGVDASPTFRVVTAISSGILGGIVTVGAGLVSNSVLGDRVGQNVAYAVALLVGTATTLWIVVRLRDARERRALRREFRDTDRSKPAPRGQLVVEGDEARPGNENRD